MSDVMTGSLVLQDGMAFEATSGSGHTLVLDASPQAGGQERGPRPMELLLLGVGGCTAMDVISILRKMRQEITDYRVDVSGDRTDEHPRVFTTLLVEHIITGRRLDEAMVRRAIELSDTRYCSATAMLREAVAIQVRYRLIDADTGVEQVAELNVAPVR